MKLNFSGINKFWKPLTSDNILKKSNEDNNLIEDNNNNNNNNNNEINEEKRKNKKNYSNSSSTNSDNNSENNNSNNYDSDDSDSGDIFVVNEHERWRNDLGWSYRNLEMGDPKRYVSKLHSSDHNMEATLPSGWQYIGKWKVDTTVPGSDSGWLYAYDFRTLDVREDKAGNANQRHFVRRKRWIRKVALVVGENALNEEESRDGSSISDTIDGGGGSGGGYAPSIISTSESFSLNQSDFSNSIHHLTNDNDNNNNNNNNNNNEVGDDDEEETDEEIFKVLTNDSQNNIPILKDQRLLSIGKKMKVLEAECQKDDEQKLKDFHQNIEPSYKKTIKELDQRINELRKRIQSELMMGDEHIALLEQELQAHVEVQDATKRSLYFPNSVVTLGTGGVYFALDDFWLEYGSGQFIVDLVPSRETPQVIVLLTGAADGNDSGVAIRLQIGGFKLRGDSGKGVPRISLDTVKVTVTIRVTVMLTYNMKQKTWTSPANNFRVEMLQFKGPFGLSRSVVSGVLTIVVPILREQLLKVLPPELGMFISSLPSPLSIRGEFNITGTELKHMSHAMFKSEQMCSLVGYTPEQLLKWIAIQKSIGRTPLIKTMHELLKYRRLGTTHHKQWDELRLLWNQASIIYFDKTNADQNQEFPISFERILQGTDEILRNPIKVKFTLHNCDGQISVRNLIDNTQLFFERWRASSKDTSQDIGQLVMLLQKFNQQLDLAREALALTTEHLDFINLKLALTILAGSKGEIGVTITDILAQAPLALWTAMPKDLSFGFESPVPFLTTIRPQTDGGINIEILHCGKEIQHRATFYEWENKVGRNKPQVPPPTSSKKKKRRPAVKVQHSSSSDIFNNDNSSEKNHSNSLESLTPPPSPALSIPTMSREASDASISSDSTPPKQQQQQQQQQLNGDESNEVNRNSNDTESNINVNNVNNNNNILGLGSTPPKPDFIRNSSITKTKDTNDLPRESTSSIISTITTTTTTTTNKPVRRQSLFSSLGYSTPQTTTQITQSTIKSKSTGIKFSKKKKVDETMSTSEKQRIELERTLANKPHAYEAHRIMNIRVFCPHVSIIVDKPVSLKPGSELFTFRVGPLERGWRPFGYDPNQAPAHTRTSVINRHPSVLALSRPSEIENKIEPKSPNNKIKKVVPLEGFDEDDEVEGGPEVIPLDGCPLLLQTSRHIKILAQVPNVQVNIYLAKLLKFFSLYFEDIERLRKYLGVITERAKEQTEEYIYLFKVLLDRLGKYLLLPNLDLSLNISIKVVATDNDVNLSFETALNNNNNNNPISSTPSQPNNSNTLKLTAKVNVMDVIADSIAIKNSLLRCAQIYEKYCAEDAEKEAARKLAEEDEYEDVDEDSEDEDGDDDVDKQKNQNDSTQPQLQLKSNNQENRESKGSDDNKEDSIKL